MGDHLATIDGPKSRGLLCPFLGNRRKSEPKQLQGTSTDVEWPVIASLIIIVEDKR